LPGLSFFHKDWEIACDNTRTCRAAGYQTDEDELPVSVLLTRMAGPKQAVTGQVMIGNYDDEGSPKKPPKNNQLTLKINGKDYGKVQLKQDSLVADLSQEQVTALVSALSGKSVIEWSAEESKWHLSDKGAAAVLLKMDEFQGRLGTTGALIKKGSQSEDKVLPALPMPVLVAAKVPAQKSSVGTQDLADALRATTSQGDCDMLFDKTAGEAQILTFPLNGKKHLASTLCWRAAYNEGYGYWLINGNKPYDPVLIVASGSDYADGVISSALKGRGLGDCWSSDSWVWNGSQFVHTESATTGMCKLVAPGGAWTLPIIASEVSK
jgi:hypothetical protein